MVAGGMSIVKYLTFFFNFIFVLCSIALIVIGSIAAHKAKGYGALLGNGYIASSVIVIIVGCVILMLAFLGCCGAIKENYCMLMTFSVILMIIFIVELAAGIAAYVFRGKLNDVLKKAMENTMKDYKEKINIDLWDELQKERECCGIDGPGDWNNVTLTNAGKIPDSCCKNKTDECTTCTSGQTDNCAYSKGCLKDLEKLFKDNIWKVAVAALVIAFIQLLGVIFGCCLARAIKKEYETV